MAGFSSWLEGNWSNAVAAAGIIGGLVFTGANLMYTAASFRQQAKAKETDNIFALKQQHAELWGQAERRPELSRILLPDADLAQPITVAEEEFLNLVAVHFETGWEMAKEGTMLTHEVLARDLRGFFALPLPRAVWEKTKATRNPRFVRFVERAIDASGRLTRAGDFEPMVKSPRVDVSRQIVSPPLGGFCQAA